MQIFLEVLILLFWLFESSQRTVAPMRTFWQVELNLLVHSSMQLFYRWLEPSSHELYSWEKQLFPEKYTHSCLFIFKIINVNMLENAINQALFITYHYWIKKKYYHTTNQRHWTDKVPCINNWHNEHGWSSCNSISNFITIDINRITSQYNILDQNEFGIWNSYPWVGLHLL